MSWSVWSPPLGDHVDGGVRMEVEAELTEKGAHESAERRNAAAKKHGAKHGYSAAKTGLAPEPYQEEEEV